MIRILNMKDLSPTECDYCICIMRSDRHLRTGITHMPELSPSWDLFKRYLELNKRGEWNNDVFHGMYVPEFIKQMCSRKSRDALNWLWAQSYIAKEIQVGCTCVDESMCHRSIVGGILEGTGAHVEFASGKSYSDYYGMWVATDRLVQADRL